MTHINERPTSTPSFAAFWAGIIFIIIIISVLNFIKPSYESKQTAHQEQVIPEGMGNQ